MLWKPVTASPALSSSLHLWGSSAFPGHSSPSLVSSLDAVVAWKVGGSLPVIHGPGRDHPERRRARGNRSPPHRWKGRSSALETVFSEPCWEAEALEALGCRAGQASGGGGIERTVTVKVTRGSLLGAADTCVPMLSCHPSVRRMVSCYHDYRSAPPQVLPETKLQESPTPRESLSYPYSFSFMMGLHLQGCGFHCPEYLRKLRLQKAIFPGSHDCPCDLVLPGSLDLKHLAAGYCACLLWVCVALLT